MDRSKIALGIEIIVLTVTIAFGLVTRFHEIGYNFDGDEVFSVELARDPFEQVIYQSLEDRPHPPLHNILLHFWILAFGDSEISVRTLSILFSLSFLLIVYKLARGLMPPAIAIGVVAILSLSPLFIYYGQQARPYSLIAFLSAINFFTFIRYLEEPKGQKRVSLWAVTSMLLLYAQYIAGLTILLEICIGFIFLRSKRVKTVLYGGLSISTIIPWFVVAIGPQMVIANDPLPHISWISTPTLNTLIGFFVDSVGECLWLQSRWLLFIFILLLLLYARRVYVAKAMPASHIFFFAIGIGVPAIVFALSVWGPKSIFAERQMLGAALSFIIVLGLCLANLPKFLAGGFLLILIVWTVGAFPQAFPHNTKPPWRTIAADIDSEFISSTVVVLEEWAKIPLSHYQKRRNVRFWQELSEDEKEKNIVIVCRPSICDEFLQREPTFRARFKSEWNWGLVSADHKILLFELIDNQL